MPSPREKSGLCNSRLQATLQERAVADKFGGAPAQNIGMTNFPNFPIQRGDCPVTNPPNGMTLEMMKEGTQNRQSKVKSDGAEKWERIHGAKSGYGPDPRTAAATILELLLTIISIMSEPWEKVCPNPFRRDQDRWHGNIPSCDWCHSTNPHYVSAVGRETAVQTQPGYGIYTYVESYSK
jgi:hypothetical protein